MSGLGSLTRLSLESPLRRRTVGAVDFFLALAAAAATAASRTADSASPDDDACCCARRATGDEDEAAAILCAREMFELGLRCQPIDFQYHFTHLILRVSNHQPSESSSDPFLSKK